MTNESSPRKWIFASLFAALLGMVDTAVLTANHYKIANEGLMGRSFCNLSSTIDCDTALMSAHAYLWKIPNSELGFLFYFLIALFCAWALVAASKRHSLLSFLLHTCFAGILYSLYMAYILFFKLKVICLMCTASYILTLALFIFLLAATKTKPWKFLGFVLTYIKRTFNPPTDKAQKTALAQYLMITIIIFGIGTYSFYRLNKQAHAKAPKFNRQVLLNHFYSQKPFALNLTEGPSHGPQNALITIVNFTDFQCPFCRIAAFSLRPYLGEFRNEVRIFNLNYPLDQTCNPSVQNGKHPAACLAAKAALCAYEKKGEASFWKFHDLAFEKQRRLSYTMITEELAPKIGMTKQAMAKCMTSNKIETRLAREIKLGKSVGVNGTPAIFINGRQFRGWNEPKILRAIIKAELERVRKKPAL